jgi:6-pyruvoyl-tetrahydropterin synthase
MVMDLGLLDRILREEVQARFDRRHLGDVAEFAPGAKIPTGESLCLDVWNRVSARLPDGCALDVVRIAEDATLFSEFRGED